MFTPLATVSGIAPEKRWFVIHTYSGYEAKVRDALQHVGGHRRVVERRAAAEHAAVERPAEDDADATFGAVVVGVLERAQVFRVFSSAW